MKIITHSFLDEKEGIIYMHTTILDTDSTNYKQHIIEQSKLKERHIEQSLIKLGWTPPPTQGDVNKSL